MNRNFPDYSKPFCINGMEIDLNELEIYEKQLAEKRRTQMDASTVASTTANVENTDQTVDEIDAYLEQLALDLKTKDQQTTPHTDNKQTHNDTPNTPNTSNTPNTPENGINPCTVAKQCSSQTNDNIASNSTAAQFSSQTSFPLLLFSFLTILAFVNSVQCKNAFKKLLQLIESEFFQIND